MNNIVKTDIAIIGGGIAGLWLLNRLRALGYSTLLFESESLGGGQTHKAQGIIHGGIKYALQGVMTGAAQAISQMPTIWQQCLQGKGEIDLREVSVLSPRQYLWSPNTLAGKLSGFFANLAMNSQVRTLKKQEFPEFFQRNDFDGQVYALDEMVIDVNSLIRQLVKPCPDAIFKINPLSASSLHIDSTGRLAEMEVTAGLQRIIIKAKKYIFTAGAGNEELLKAFKIPSIGMQRRPLHMVMMKSDSLSPLYAHCLGMSATPRITITTHRSQDNKTVWYMGGQLAEEGVRYDSQKQIQLTQQELHQLFTWLDLRNAQFASFLIDRAEGLQGDGKRPDSCVVKEIENVIVTWPTKLALAPKLSAEIIASIERDQVTCSSSDENDLKNWPKPAITQPIWDILL